MYVRSCSPLGTESHGNCLQHPQVGKGGGRVTVVSTSGCSAGREPGVRDNLVQVSHSQTRGISGGRQQTQLGLGWGVDVRTWLWDRVFQTVTEWQLGDNLIQGQSCEGCFSQERL